MTLRTRYQTTDSNENLRGVGNNEVYKKEGRDRRVRVDDEDNVYTTYKTLSDV